MKSCFQSSRGCFVVHMSLTWRAAHANAAWRRFVQVVFPIQSKRALSVLEHLRLDWNSDHEASAKLFLLSQVPSRVCEY